MQKVMTWISSSPSTVSLLKKVTEPKNQQQSEAEMWKAMRRLYANHSLLLRLSLLLPLIPLLYSLLFVPLVPNNETASATSEILGVKIEKNPPQSKLTELGVSTWSTWEGGPMKIPWTFKAKETIYLLKGRVKVTVDGHEDDGSFEIGGGDLVIFPKGMNITWEVIEDVKKHYNLEKEN